MRWGLCTQVGLDEEDDIQRLCKLLMQQLGLVHVGLDMPFHGGLLEVLLWHVGIIHFSAILATWPSPAIGAGVGEVQGGITAQLGNQVQMTLPRHLEGIVVAEVSVEDEVGQWDKPGDQVPQAVEHAGDVR